MSTKEAIYTNKKQVSCNGKEAPFDHPLVYLVIDETNEKVQCPYCSKIFILKSSEHKSQ